jgi:chemotaxis receptor (MCP) glutamine deamidase CheD
MQIVTVDVASLHFENSETDLIQARSLGAGVCTGIYDPGSRIGGAYIFIFPDSSNTSVDPDEHPLLFADTGLKRFFQAARNDYGMYVKEAKIAVCGGACFLDAIGDGHLGERNCEAAWRFFEAEGIRPGLILIGGMENYCLEIDLKLGELRVEMLGGGIKRI